MKQQANAFPVQIRHLNWIQQLQPVPPAHLNNLLSVMVPVVNAHILLHFGTQEQNNVNNVQNNFVITISQVNNALLVMMIVLIMILFQNNAESALSKNLNLTKILDTVKDVIMRNLI